MRTQPVIAPNLLEQIEQELENMRARGPSLVADQLVGARRIAEWVCWSVLCEEPDSGGGASTLARLAQRVRQDHRERKDLFEWLSMLAADCNPAAHGGPRGLREHQQAWNRAREPLRSVLDWYYGVYLGRPTPPLVEQALGVPPHLRSGRPALTAAVAVSVAAVIGVFLTLALDHGGADGSPSDPVAAGRSPATADSGADAPAPADAPGCPADMVRIDGPEAFCIDRTEVALGAYSSCPESECPRHGTPFWQDGARAQFELQGAFCTTSRSTCSGPTCVPCEGTSCDNHPMNCVDFDSARRFCASLGRRLPTEAEWVLAARGPEGWTYPWGGGQPTSAVANICEPECVALANRRGLRGTTWVAAPDHEPDGYMLTAPVDAFPDGASHDRVLQLAGNVAEWVVGADGSSRARGGGFLRFKVFEDRAWVRSDVGASVRRNGRYLQLGFRCACTFGSCSAPRP